MAQESWPSPGHNSRAVTDAEYEQLAQRFSDDGIVGDPTQTAVCSAGVGLQVVVRSGVYGSLRGHAWYSGAVNDTLTIGSNSSGSTRTDRVVLRLTRSTWTVRAVILPGTPGAGAPALTQDTGDTGVYEIPLATVTVPTGASSVTVVRGEQYIGTRIRPCLSTALPANPIRGAVVYETDTGRWRGWNGTSWVTQYEDTGNLTLGAGFDTWVTAGSNSGRMINGVVWLRVAVQRTGSALFADDGDGSKIATVPAALRPTVFNQFYGAQFSGGRSCRVQVRINGEIWVDQLSATAPVGSSLFLTMTYFRG